MTDEQIRAALALRGYKFCTTTAGGLFLTRTHNQVDQFYAFDSDGWEPDMFTNSNIEIEPPYNQDRHHVAVHLLGAVCSGD